ncbi:MAG: DNA-3-methyladenine glycosylase 2 family protein [Clostridiales bacterium]|nr:DNA-3-methyladenine glycosylase 2 family protein [Clostridiales bacterium]
MKYIFKDGNVEVTEFDNINIALTLDCGQAFRWSSDEKGVWHGVAFGKVLDIEQTQSKIIFFNTSLEDFEKIWLNYFDLERDYKKITSQLKKDEQLNKAITACYGIRILRQESWEALCSFIISQNNNIPRIKGIIERMCKCFGEDLSNGDFSFPSAEKIATLSVEDLSPLRAGFRARYIIDAAQRVADGRIDIEKISAMDIEKARESLKTITGVGAKVAECTLLYGFNRIEAFPIDVWVKRVMAEMYPNGLPECTKGIEGIAQQFLFHYIRTK